MYCQNIFGDHRVFEDLKEFEIVKIERDRMVGYEETRSIIDLNVNGKTVKLLEDNRKKSR